ncbi:MAG: DUF2478 domain-containing protein [Proteobacteria bacterium]|nr:DUF2478 domain-containing protein [Pseudomonadota bacterium]
MADQVARIAVVQGAPSADVQTLFWSLAERWRPTVRLAGVLAEDHGLPGRACSAGYLCSLSDGARYPIFQDLGRDSQTCHLAGDGASLAAAAVRRDVDAGCDLVMLSKFGKLEAEGGGLRDAFAAAIERGVPILTSVSKVFLPKWESFAAPLFKPVALDVGEIEAWRQTVRPRAGLLRPASAARPANIP